MAYQPQPATAGGDFELTPDGVLTIHRDSAWRTRFQERQDIRRVVIMAGVTTIGEDAFYTCANLTSIVISNSVTTIGSLAFWDCTNLTSIVIPNSVTTIEVCAFFECRSLTSVVIPNSVTRIEAGTFAGCTSLTSVVIPNGIGVEAIGDNAFDRCTSLKFIICSEAMREELMQDRARLGLKDVLLTFIPHDWFTGVCAKLSRQHKVADCAIAQLGQNAALNTSFDFTYDCRPNLTPAQILNIKECIRTVYHIAQRLISTDSSALPSAPAKGGGAASGVAPVVPDSNLASLPPLPPLLPIEMWQHIICHALFERDYISGSKMWKTLRGLQTYTETLPYDAIEQLRMPRASGGGAGVDPAPH